jgi:broad specificity phosphatase PhoE
MAKPWLLAEVPPLWDTDGVSEENPFDGPLETRTDFDDRVRAWTEEWAAAASLTDRVLVVAHYEWIRAWFHIYQGRDVEPANAEVLYARLGPAKS